MPDTDPLYLALGPRPNADDVVFLVQAGYHLADAIAAQAELGRLGVGASLIVPLPPGDVLRSLRSSTARHREILRHADDAGLTVTSTLTCNEVSEAASALVVRNDWGPSRTLVGRARDAGVPVVGWVEGVQDFDDDDTGRQRDVYARVDMIFSLGAYDLDRLADRGVPVIPVGSERLWRRWHGPPTTAEFPLLANVNFTYGVRRDARRGWVSDVVAAARSTGTPLGISRHPADRSRRGRRLQLSGGIDEHLPRTGRLISRFSTAVYDALALGVDVVYYNPHGERVPTFCDPRGAFRVVTDTDSLVGELRSAPPPATAIRESASAFLHHHLTLEGDAPSVRAARELNALVA